MTDTTQTPEIDTSTQQVTDTTPPTTETTPDTDERTDGKDDKEAAKYRRRLRDTETERDTLATRLETMQRAEAERLAAEHLAAGADLWLTGTQVADLLDDDGNLDPTKVATAATTLGTDRPHWRRTSTAAAPAGEVTGRDKIDGDAPSRSWSDLLRSNPPTK